MDSSTSQVEWDQLKSKQEQILDKLSTLARKFENIEQSQHKLSSNLPQEWQNLKENQEHILDRLHILTVKVGVVQAGLFKNNVKTEPTSYNTLTIENVGQHQKNVLLRIQRLLNNIKKYAHAHKYDLEHINLLESSFESIAKLVNEVTKKVNTVTKDEFRKSLTTNDLISPELKETIMKETLNELPKETENVTELAFKENINVDDLDVTKTIPTFENRQEELNKKSITMRNTCKALDVSGFGKIDSATLIVALKNLGIKDVINSNYMNDIINLFKDNNDLIDYNGLCDLFCNVNNTKNTNLENQWNLFRNDILGSERKDGSIRILYRYDGWPIPQICFLNNYDTKNKNVISLNEIISNIEKHSKEKVEYEQLYYNINNFNNKPEWHSLNNNNNQIPLYVSKDGHLEIDIWLRTKGFLNKQGGKPAPKESIKS